MAKRTHKTLDAAKRQAEARFRELVEELKLLTVSFPHLSESFDPDELPVSFILKREHDRAVASSTRTPRPSARQSARKRRPRDR
jgi:hypothetical protein